MRLDKALLVFKKDFIEISRNKEVLLPMFLLPLIIALIIPALTVISPESISSDVDVDIMIENMMGSLPEQTREMLSGFNNIQLATYVMAVYFFAPFFLIIPVMSSSVIAADSFAGEKERNTLEALLATPLTDSELLLGKILVSFVPGMGVTLLGAALYAVTLDLLTYDLFGRYIMPTVPWLVMILVLAPMIALLGTAVTVIISSRVRGFREAQQLGSILVIPILALLFGQATGYLMLGSRVMIVLACLIGALDLVLFRFGLRLFQRENILAQSR